MTYKPLVFLAVLSTAAILACKDDPIGPDGTGRLTITVVPYENAEAEASAASDAESSAEASPSTTTNRGTARPWEQTSDETGDLNVGPENEEAKAATQPAAAPPRRDLLRVNLSGPDTRSLDFTPNADGSVDVTIQSLPEGTYSVELLGLDTDLGPELVSEYGVNNSVTVRSDQTTNATISFGSFLPVIDPTLPAQTSEFSFVVDYAAIPSATGYFFELDTAASFSAPTTLSLTGTSVVITTDVLGPNWMRVRAENSSVPAAQAKPSDPVLIDVVADISPTGDDNTTAPSLGTGPGASGQYSNFNIYPATDEDWFAIDLATDVTLTVDVLTESLSSPPSGGAVAALEVISAGSGPSPLDPEVEIYDPSLNVIATNDDRDSTTVESRVSDVAIPVDGTYFIRVTSFLGGSVGHYELLITVNAEPVARVQIDPPSATILPASTVDLEGRTFDQFDVEVFSREAIWSSSDGVIATVDGTGLVTGQSIGTATITFESEGISNTATIGVTNIPAAKVVITPTSGLLQGIGQTVQWSAQAFDASNNVITGKPINWWGSNPAVADADAGLVEAFGNGQSIIVAEADGVEGYALITVTDPLSSVVNYWSDGPSLPSGSENLLAIWGASSSAIYTVGTNGTILFNDGSGWSGLGVATTASLSGVWGADDQEIWTVGSGGKIFMSPDGVNWNAEVSPTTEPLRGVWGAAFDDVYAVGGSPGVAAMVHWDGTSWTAVTGLPVANALNGVYGFASDEVFAVGDNGTIIRFDGTSWSAMINATVESLFAVWGTSPSDVYAVGASGRIVHYDGNVGQNWVSVASGTTESLLAVWGTNPTDVLAAGTNGAVVHYDGTTWSPQVSGTTNALRAIWGSPNPGVTVVGDLGTVRLGSRGASVIVTPGTGQMDALGNTLQLSAEVQDGVGTVLTGGTFSWGSSDNLVATVTATGLVTAVGNGVATITASNGGISGTSDITVQQVAATVTITPNAAQLKTGTATQSLTATATDANTNPIAGATFNWTSLSSNIVTIDAAGLATQVAAGQATISADLDGAFGFALVTSTGAFGLGPVNLWSIDNSNETANFTGVWGSSRSDIYAVADNGTITAYDGTDWTQSLNDPSSAWNGIWGLMPSEIYVVGNGGRLGLFDGSTWSVSTIGTAQDLWSVWGTSPVDIFAVGNNGTIMHLDAGGWSAQTIGTQPLQRVWGTSSSDVFAIGGMGTILHYDGVSWSAQASGTTTSLFAIWGTAPNDVFVAGVGGATHHYNGVSWSVMTTPNTFGIMGLWGTATADLYGVGDQGATVFYNGATWSSITPIATEGLKDVWGTSNPVVIAVGDGGRIVRGSRGVTTSILPTTTNLDALGATVQLTAEARDQADDVIVGVPWVWSSSNDLIATVDQNGLVTAVDNGSVTITASAQGFVLNATVNVAQVSVGFGVVPDQASIAIGETLQLVGGSLDANGNPILPQPPITWSTDIPAVATVDIASGLVTAVGVGTATITADDGIATPATAAITVTVPNTAHSIAAGSENSCAIADGGSVYCWGSNDQGQLGDGTTNNATSPVPVAGGFTFQSLTVGGNHTCGLTPDGSAYCWGQGGSGQLGDNLFTSSSTPVAVAGGHKFAELSGGGYHTCGITTAGVPYCWGQSNNGELGDGTLASQGQPVGVAGGHTFQSIATGWNHSCGVNLTGNVYCWGWNSSGQLGDGTTAQSNIPVMVSNPGGLVFRGVAGGGSHSCALVDASDGTDPSAVYCWGSGGSGQLGNAFNNNSSTPVKAFGAFVFRSVSAGLGSHTCAVTTTDVGYCWGNGWDGQLGDGSFNSFNIPTPIAGGLSFAEVSAGGGHTCGRTTGGNAYCWGSNGRSAIGNGDPATNQPAFVLSNASSVTAGNQHACVLNSSALASCWGAGSSGQIGQGLFQDELSITAVSGALTYTALSGAEQHTCGLLASPGDIYCWGNGGQGAIGQGSFSSVNVPTLVIGGHQFAQMDAGGGHACGVSLGNIYCWGENDQGQLGDNTTVNKNQPTLVSGTNTYTSVSVSGGWRGNTCALTNTGLAFCWGYNNDGQVGDATNTDRWVPTAVSGGTSYTQIVVGGFHACALDATGLAYCWGRGWDGQLGNNQWTTANTPQAVAGGFTYRKLVAGDQFTCGIRTTGETHCWGAGWAGQLGDGSFNNQGLPTTIAGGHSFTGIDAGNEFVCGVDAGGSLYCWGRNDQGQLGLGNTDRIGAPTLVAGGLTYVVPPPEER